MAGNDIQTTLQFQADITDFKGAMQEAKRTVKLANSEFAATSSTMDDWGTSTDGLKAKIKQLDAVHQAEARRLEVLRAAYEKTVKEQGESSAAAQDLAAKINNQQAAVNKAAKQVETYSEKLDEMAGSAVSAEKATENLGKVGNFVAGAFKALVAGAAAVVTGFVAMAEGTREYRTAIGKVSTAFEDAGMSADMGKQMYKDFYAVLGDQDKTTEAISNLAMLTNDQQALSEWTGIATGVFAKFGDALPIESLTEAANETAKTGTLTGALADALNWAGVNEEAFQEKLDACTTSAQREALIRETLNGLYTEAGQKYRETNADIIASNEAQARLTDAMATMGAKVEPAITAVKNGFATLAEKVASFLTEANMEAITAAINSAFAWFIDTALPTIQAGIGWVIDNKDILLALVSGIAAGFAAWTVVQTVTSAIGAFTSFKKTLDLVKTGQLALNAALNMNPIGIVITLVAALVAAFITLWNNSESFRNFWLNMWEGIKQKFAALVQWFKNAAASIAQFFSNAWQNIKNIWSAVTGFFSGIWRGITSIFSGVGSWFGNIFRQAWTGITTAFSSVGSFFSGVWQKIKGVFSIDGMLDIGRNLVQGLWNGISNSFNWIKDKISGWVGNVMDFIKGLFGINSPSRVMRDEVGKMLGLGMAEGITDSRNAVTNAMRQLDDAVWNNNKPKGSPAAGAAGAGAAGGKTIIINQTNNSPKALSRLEIYRQTHNALSFAGGA